jgi:hypothetical protein
MALYDFTASEDLPEEREKKCISLIKKAAKRCDNCKGAAKFEMCSKHQRMMETITG